MRILRFLGGLALGLVPGVLVAAVAVLGLGIIALVEWGDLPERRPAGQTPRVLRVDGRAVSAIGGVELRVGKRWVRLACRGACDDLRFDPAGGALRVRVFNASGACVVCKRRGGWVDAADGTRVFAPRMGDTP